MKIICFLPGYGRSCLSALCTIDHGKINYDLIVSILEWIIDGEHEVGLVIFYWRLGCHAITHSAMTKSLHIPAQLNCLLSHPVLPTHSFAFSLIPSFLPSCICLFVCFCLSVCLCLFVFVSVFVSFLSVSSYIHFFIH